MTLLLIALTKLTPASTYRWTRMRGGVDAIGCGRSGGVVGAAIAPDAAGQISCVNAEDNSAACSNDALSLSRMRDSYSALRDSVELF